MPCPAYGPRSSHAVVASQTETADGNIIRFLNYSHEHIEIESAAKLIKRKLASQIGEKLSSRIWSFRAGWYPTADP